MRVDPNYVTNLVSALDRAQAREQQLSGELSSGVRVNSLSDDPIVAAQNVMLLNQIQRDDSFTQSADLVTGQLQVADSALRSVVSQLNEAISLATSADNGTMNASDVESISSQIAGILKRGPVAGKHQLSGPIHLCRREDLLDFSTSNATSPAVTAYAGDDDVNYLSTPDGQKIQLNVPGDQIFLGSSSVFGTLNNLVADFSSGTRNSAQAQQDTQALTCALNYVSQQRVSIDNSLTQLTAASSAVSTEGTQLKGSQSDLMQADLATVATQLSLSQTQMTALESVISQLGSGSLFDKLQ